MEVLKHSDHCTSCLVLEGRAEVAEQAAAVPHLEAEPGVKRRRSVRECVQERYSTQGCSFQASLKVRRSFRAESN